MTFRRGHPGRWSSSPALNQPQRYLHVGQTVKMIKVTLHTSRKKLKLSPSKTSKDWVWTNEHLWKCWIFQTCNLWLHPTHTHTHFTCPRTQVFIQDRGRSCCGENFIKTQTVRSVTCRSLPDVSLSWTQLYCLWSCMERSKSSLWDGARSHSPPWNDEDKRKHTASVPTQEKQSFTLF